MRTVGAAAGCLTGREGLSSHCPRGAAAPCTLGQAGLRSGAVLFAGRRSCALAVDGHRLYSPEPSVISMRQGQLEQQRGCLGGRVCLQPRCLHWCIRRAFSAAAFVKQPVGDMWLHTWACMWANCCLQLMCGMQCTCARTAYVRGSLRFTCSAALGSFVSEHTWAELRWV